MVPVGWLVPGCWLVPIVGLLVKSCDKAGNTASANNGSRIEAWLPECRWYGMQWYGIVWYGMQWYALLWYAVVWYGMQWLPECQNPFRTLVLN